MAISSGENQAAMQDPKPEGFDSRLVFRDGPRVAPRPDVPKMKSEPGFEYAEHGFIGDTITLTLPNGQSSVAVKYPFKLPNGLSVTYGQINGLAGDFYGTTKPISDGTSPKDQGTRFQAAYETLALNKASRQPAEAQSILVILQKEVAAINEALKKGIDPSSVYAKLDDETWSLQDKTLRRPSDQPTYIGLAKINWDHFGADARTAYNAGHTMALQQAIQGSDPQNLFTAYTMNAFADHFLQDSFSAGHLRTPRRQLHSTSGDADLCAKYMHDEDNAIGLSVQNPRQETWQMYGDKRLLDTVDVTNQVLVTKAIQASANEIFQAWSTKQMPTPDIYQAWQYAPTLDSARAVDQKLVRLFTFESQPQRRAVIADRCQSKFTLDYWYSTTALDCRTSGLWNYPITLNCASTNGQPEI
ncbi:MAG: hypothetical protein M1833_003031 [Piccolia ochrophora]|nr:MAG: hypothetical protein M1833_003031 [Piccolia ochrophora]